MLCNKRQHPIQKLQSQSHQRQAKSKARLRELIDQWEDLEDILDDAIVQAREAYANAKQNAIQAYHDGKDDIEQKMQDTQQAALDEDAWYAKMSKAIVAVGPESSDLNTFNQVGSARLVASDFVLSKVW